MKRQRTYLVRIRPRNDTLYVSQGRTVLATDLDGFLSGGVEKGLFVHETRLLSKYRYRIAGRSPLPVALSNVEQYSWLGYYITLPPGFELGAPDTGSGLVQPSSEHTLELRLARYVGQGLHEDVDLHNYSLEPTEFTLELEIDADFADQIETRSQRQQMGELSREWKQVKEGVWELIFDYRAEHEYDHQGNTGTAQIHRRIAIRVENVDSPPHYDDGKIQFHLELGPQETWHACVNMIPWIDGERMEPLYKCRSFRTMNNEYDRKREIFLHESTSFSTPEMGTLTYSVLKSLENAKQDLASLRLYDLDHGDRAWIMSAGLPIYLALFGRDSLTTAWQAGMLSPDMLRGTPAELARWQGTEVNDWRDEQPGKMIHEAHTGPLEMLNYNPRKRYYGSITTSGFFPVVLSELWHWTGDRELVGSLIDPMLDALKWLEEYGDLNGDGFYEYKTRSEQGSKHQAWKDSRDAIVYEDGSQVEPPIATCEEQGFVYLAKLRAAEVLWWFDRRDDAIRLYREAGELKKRFNDVFWMEDEGYFAMGLDSERRQIKSIGSNPGHLLGTAIVDSDLVEKTAQRMFQEDLFTGWGIRTLSAENPAYNPYSYHRGSVWPVEHGTFAVGLMRFGLHDLMHKVCQAQFEAASIFDHFRLPEVFSGHARDRGHPFPGLYPQTNSPQAWSASAVYLMVQSLLGIYPYAPLNMLLIDPQLPDWLPSLTIENMRVGNARTTIHFFRKEDGASDYEILDITGNLRIIRQPSPWSLTASFGERLRDGLTSFIPGK